MSRSGPTVRCRRPTDRLLAVLVVALLAGCGGADAPRRSGHVPVVFVHGYGGSAGDWDAASTVLREAGWTADELRALDYDSTRPNAQTARDVAATVADVLADTGAQRVDLVTFSMGALSTRAYLAQRGGTARVRRWVSLGGPNAGAAFARGCRTAACADMRPGSPLLRALNAGDPTPGPTAYATWWSPCDEIIVPARSVLLEGARNTRTACLRHGALLGDATVLRQVRAYLAA